VEKCAVYFRPKIVFLKKVTAALLAIKEEINEIHTIIMEVMDFTALSGQGSHRIPYTSPPP
jgi:hypothetical protein